MIQGGPTLAVLLALGLSGCAFHLPWIETKAEVKAKLAQSHADLKAATASLGAAGEVNKALQAQLAVKESLETTAAGHVATIQAVEDLASDGSRKDTIVSLAAGAAASALPRVDQSDVERIKAEAQRMLSEKDTTISELQKKYADARSQIERQQADLESKDAEVKAKTDAYEAIKKLPPKVITVIKEKLVDTLGAYKWWIAGLFIAIGIGFVIIGSVMGRALMTAKGMLIVIVSLLVGSIPTEWYLVGAGGLTLIGIIYAAVHWKRQDTLASNAVGIIQEVKQSADSATVSLIKQKAGEYWGTTAKEVAKADALVGEKLRSMNFTWRPSAVRSA